MDKGQDSPHSDRPSSNDLRKDRETKKKEKVKWVDEKMKRRRIKR
jgi:hypothetical protein